MRVVSKGRRDGGCRPCTTELRTAVRIRDSMSMGIRSTWKKLPLAEELAANADTVVDFGEDADLKAGLDVETKAVTVAVVLGVTCCTNDEGMRARQISQRELASPARHMPNSHSTLGMGTISIEPRGFGILSRG